MRETDEVPIGNFLMSAGGLIHVLTMALPAAAGGDDLVIAEFDVIAEPGHEVSAKAAAAATAIITWWRCSVCVLDLFSSGLPEAHHLRRWGVSASLPQDLLRKYRGSLLRW